MLTDDALKDLERTYRRVQVVSTQGHELVFRYPRRDETHMFRKKAQSVDIDERVDRFDWFFSTLIVAFDDARDTLAARLGFDSLIEDYGDITGATKFQVLAQELLGQVEKENAEELGNALSARNVILRTLAMGSPNGSATAQGQAPTSPPTAGQPLPS